jgi:hypothetical protein
MTNRGELRLRRALQYDNPSDIGLPTSKQIN